MSDTRTSEAIREQVVESYTNVVERTGGCCCAGEQATEQKGVAAKLAGYAKEDLGALPADAVTNSFGCGNPVALADLREGDVVLDLGSGAGIDLLLSAARVGKHGHVIGVDMTDAMLEKARSNIAASGHTNVEVRKGLIEALPVDSDTVDRVISNCVINLSPEKTRVFREIARVLKPGGSVAISDIVVENLPAALRNDACLYSGCIAGAISEPAYLAGLEEAGLVDVEVTDRVVYDKEQLAALITSDIVEETTSDTNGCGCGSVDPKDAPRIAREIEGNVWSMRVRARKP